MQNRSWRYSYKLCLKCIRYRYSGTEEESQADKAKKAVENVYENIREKFDSVMLRMRSSLQNPRNRDLIFYVLLSIFLREGFKKRSGREGAKI